jgi:hypothetical protein
MPRYFFDIHDGVSMPDKEGHEVADMNAVRAEAQRALTEIASHSEPRKDAIQLRMDVRDSNDKRVLTTTLLMVSEVAQ